MPKKTATLFIYQMYATNAYACEIKYKGQCLDVMRSQLQYECTKQAFYKAKALGFTHAKLTGVDKPYILELSALSE